jgi:hypothetical protein
MKSFRQAMNQFPEVTGEAADDRMDRALRASGCIIVEKTMLQMAKAKGWMHMFNIRRPRWFPSLFGYAAEQHMCITAEVWGPSRIRYKVSCMRTDGKGSLKQWTCHGLENLLATL